VSLYTLARTLLFRIEPERAHAIGLKLLRFLGNMRVDEPSLRAETSLGDLDNVIGLAAGYDKTGEYLESLEKLGFGYLVAGTVTMSPWPGHPKPRIIRDSGQRALVNALGFPNPGLDQFIRNISSQRVSVPVVASISGQTIRDIIECYKKLQPRVSGIELNLSSPNTPKLRDLREPEAFKELATEMASHKRKPTYLKVLPYRDRSQFVEVLQLVKTWSELGFEGATASNTLLIDESRLATGTGGLSGPPLFPRTVEAIRAIRNVVPISFEINAVGGISSGKDVVAALKEGATTVQIFTAVVFDGPTLMHRILRELSKLMSTPATLVQHAKIS